jgi:protein AroM
MTMTPLPVLLIGQSPRTAIEAEIAAAAPGLRFTTRGALDGMTREEVAGVGPKDGPDTLFTILPSGETTKISKAAVTERMTRLLGELPGPALLACTGSFPGLPDHPGLIQPSAVLNALGEALLPRGRLALFVPLSEQIDTLKAKRRREGLEVEAVALAPGSDDAAIDAAAVQLAPFRPNLVLLDCMSYTRADKSRVARTLSCPILLSIAVAARAAASMLPE